MRKFIKRIILELFQSGMLVGIGELSSSLNEIRQRCNNMADSVDCVGQEGNKR
jgi:hypothetical protein